MPCMCGDPACWSCGPAQGAPSCQWSKVRCGDETCPCARDQKMLSEEDAYEGLAEQLEDESQLAKEYVASRKVG